MRGTVAVLALASVLGCAGQRMARAVDQQHAALYGCAARDVRVTSVGRRTYAADGCGRRAIYLCRRGAVCAQQGETQATTREPDQRLHLERVAMQRADAAAIEQARARTRAAPRAPEAGGLPREGRALCESQGAAFVLLAGFDGDQAMTGELAGRRLFAAHVNAETRRIDEVDVYLEGASVPELRERYTREHGEPVEGLDDAGRSWTWQTAAGALVLRMYDRGARLTIRGSAGAPPPLAP